MKKRYLIPAGLNIALAVAIVVTDAVQGSLSVGTLFEVMLMISCAIGFVQAGLIDKLERENHWLRESRDAFMDLYLRKSRDSFTDRQLIYYYKHKRDNKPLIEIKE